MSLHNDLDELNKLFIALNAVDNRNISKAQNIFDIQCQIEANYIADILIHANLTVPKLDREYVQKLHSGVIKWKKNNGRSVSLKANFDFDLLEKLGLIFFEYDWLYFVGHLPDENLHETVQPIVEFVQQLRELFCEIYRASNFLFEIDKKYIGELLPKNYQFYSEHVKYKKKKDKYLFVIDFHHIEYKELIRQFYWKKLIQYELDNELWQKNYALSRLLDNFWMPDIKIFTDEERNRFLDFCMTNIQTSSLVQLDFGDYKKILQMDRYAYLSFVGRNTTVNIDVETGKTITKAINITYSLDEILQNNAKYIKDCQSDLELISWYHGPQSNELLFYDYILRSSIAYLMESDLYLSYPSISSQKYVNKLIDESIDHPVMRHYLVNISVNLTGRKDVIYELYLLSNPSTFIAGCLGLIQKIKQSHHTNELIMKSFYDEILSRIVRVMLETSLNSMNINSELKERDLADLLLYLAQRSDFRQESKNIELKIFKEILKQLSNKQLHIIMPFLLKEHQVLNNSYDLEKILYYLFEFFVTCQKLEEYDLCNQIQEEIFQSYKTCFENALTNKDNHLRADKTYDLFAWHQVDDGYLNKFVQLCPTTKEIVSSLSDEASLCYSNTLRNYLQVLSNIGRGRYKNNLKLQNPLKKLIVEYGFDKSYDFSLFSEDYAWNEYSVWDKVVHNLNEFDDSNFDEIIEGVKDNISLSAILALYRNVSQQNRKQKLSEFIQSKSWDMSEDNFSAIERAFIDALEQNKLELAKTALQSAQNFIDQHPYKNAKMFQEKINLWQEYQYKYDLLEIYYSDIPVEEKELKISRVLLPEFIKEKNYRDDKFTNIDRFKRYVIGLLFLKSNPDRAHNIFLRLNDEYKSSLYAYFIFISKLQSLFNVSAEESEYLSVVNSYENSFDNFYNDLSVQYKSNYLNGLYLAGKYEIINSLCSKLPYFELFDKDITVTYVKSMKDNQDELKAKAHLEKYEKYHSVDLDDEELRKLQQEVQTAIVEKVEPNQKSEIIKGVWLGRKSKDELRTAFRDINGKNIEELSWVLSEKDSEEFLYDSILSACRELLTRNKNLQILGADTNEDITNDWLTSLLNHKFSWFTSITIHDQKRTGNSASGKSPGETDGMILYKGTSVSMIEAFKLESLKQAVIDEHLNKIAGYAQSSISPIFIVVYSYASGFLSLATRYVDYIQCMQYKGFDEIQPDRHKVETLGNEGDDIAMYCEKRL